MTHTYIQIWVIVEINYSPLYAMLSYILHEGIDALECFLSIK